MVYCRNCTISLILFLVLSNVSSANNQIRIAEDGITEYAIVVDKCATEAEKHAASELSVFLKQVTDANFIITDEYNSSKAHFLIGSDAAKQVDKNFTTNGLGSEGIVIRSIGKDVILAGGRPRGTLYAVYTFLEDVVGCRWWTSTAGYIPTKATLMIEPLNIRYIPEMEYREPYWGGELDGDWAVRNKYNGNQALLDTKRGGKIAYIGSVHSFYYYMSPEKYFTSHPEWFSEVNGKRVGANAQLCLTNEQMLQEFIKNVKDDVRAHYPGASSVWVSQNDWEGICECEKCKAINNYEESPAGTNIHFANAVAEAVAEEFPKTAVNTFAYEWSQKPPKYIRVNPNVIIWLCTTGCSYNQPYNHNQNKGFKDTIETWAKIADRIYIWDYQTNFENYICPHPNLRTLGPNAKFFVKNNVKGILVNGAWEDNAKGTEMAELRRWVTCKLYWNTSLDGQKLIDEFLDGYYGPAARHIRAYLDVFHDASEASGAKLGMMETVFSDNYLSFETMYRCLKHMDEAMAAVATNKDIADRVEVARMPVLYVFLMRWDEFQEKAKAADIKWPLDNEIKQVYDYFEAVRAKNGMAAISEKNARGPWPAVKERVEFGLQLVPPECENLPLGSWADLQSRGFSSKSTESAVSDLKDEKASDGLATRLGVGHDAPMLMRQLWRVPLVTSAAQKGKKIHCWISIRSELTGKDGVAFKCGIENKNRELIVKTAEIQNEEYHTYDIGVYDDLKGWIHLYIVPEDNPENVKAIWVDRAWLVQED